MPSLLAGRQKPLRANRGYVLQTDSIVLTDTAQNLLNNLMMKKAYLGGGVS
jgi:ABC-type branched-subunit amino acid transport system ATPase component